MLRILFVDDDSNVLQAMRRAFHRMRNEWSMEFVSSGAAALDSLAKTPADVIVSDMRMPGMDGWQLLARVQQLHPQTVRLVLSGHAEPGAIMRLIGTAHQYIAKPGETQTLRAAIAQTQLLRGLLNSARLACLVGEVGTLPSRPKAFEDILKCLQHPDSSVADAARIIGRDVAMTTNILKLVNSAFFGARQSITRVDRAIAYLGMDTLASLALGHSLFHSDGSTAAQAPKLETLWLHSLQTATAARAIAIVEQFPTAQIEAAFLGGMLHDVGRVVYATRGPSRCIDPTRSEDEMSEEVERHHAEVGAYLLGLWGFPSHIVAAVALHHTPNRRADPGFDLTVLIHVADRLARAQSDGIVGASIAGVEPGLLEGLGLLEHVPRWSKALASLNGERDTT